MAGISGFSIEAMLANPSLIPTLPRGLEVQSHTHCALENARRGVDQRVQHLYKNRADRDDLEDQTRSLIQSLPCRSYLPAQKVECPVFEKICKLADEVGFTPAEKAFIQYHIIGGQGYIFIGENHTNQKFAALNSYLGGLALARELAYFQEAVCRDPESEEDHCNHCILNLADSEYANGPKPRWVFGLEGKGRSLASALQYYLMALTAPSVPSPMAPMVKMTTLSGQQVVMHNSQNYGLFSESCRSFFDEGFFNRPWREVFFNSGICNAQILSEKALQLAWDIMMAWGEMESRQAEERQAFFPPLSEKYPMQTWCELFWGIVEFCFTKPKIKDLFSSTEQRVIVDCLKNPLDEDARDLFWDTILTQRRDREFANALFFTELPKGTARVVRCGFSHLPGMIRELERLAAAQKPQEGKKV